MGRKELREDTEPLDGRLYMRAGQVDQGDHTSAHARRGDNCAGGVVDTRGNWPYKPTRLRSGAGTMRHGAVHSRASWEWTASQILTA